MDYSSFVGLVNKEYKDLQDISLCSEASMAGAKIQMLIRTVNFFCENNTDPLSCFYIRGICGIRVTHSRL